MPSFALSALLFALPLTFEELFLLSWLAPVPFYWAVIATSDRRGFFRAFGRGFFFGFLLCAFTYYWFLWMYPLDFAGLNFLESVFVVVVAHLGISLLHGALFSIPTLLARLVRRLTPRRSLLMLSAAIGLVTAQKICECSQLAFPWIRLSLGQYRAPVLIQTLSLWGVDGLDFLILAVGAALLGILLWEGKKRRAAACLALGLFFANVLFGTLRLSLHTPSDETLRVLAVQGSVLSGEKWDGSLSAHEVYTSMTEEYMTDGVEMVIWPESAVPVNLCHSELYQSDYRELSERVGVPLLMGAFWSQNGATTNSAVMIDHNGVSSVYSKQVLVPFGERLPYRSLLEGIPLLEKINLLSHDLAAGDGPVLMECDKGSLGPVICFESVFPSLVRRTVAEGAEAIVLVTNDAWYKDSTATSQHLAHAVFRSVENGRDTVRCANSGISALIDSVGRIDKEVGTMVSGTLTGDVSLRSENTLYTSWGDYIYPTVLVSFLCLCAVVGYRERRRRER